MRVVLGFPFRGDSQRTSIYQRTRPMVEDLYPWDSVFEADSGHHPFSRAATRNMIVQRAIDTSADVVVICDADSVPESEPLREAIDGCHKDGRLHVPFTIVNLLSGSLVKCHTLRLQQCRSIYNYGPSCGGVYVIRPGRWVSFGGMDERVIGWGYEDEILLVASTTLIGHYVNHPGNLYTFNHTRGVDAASLSSNTELRDSYNENTGNPDKIREIQRGSNKWCRFDDVRPDEEPAKGRFGSLERV